MRLTAARAFFAGAFLLAAFGGFARWRAHELDLETAELAERSREAGVAFTSSLSGSHQDSELGLLDLRRQRAVRAVFWGRAGLLAFGLAALALVAAEVTREIVAFNETARRIEDPHLDTRPGKAAPR